MRRPRPYQAEAVDKAEAAFLQHSSVLVVAATGMGKTYTFTELSRRWLGRSPKHRVLVMAHREELVEQAAAEMERGTGCDVGIDMERRRDRHRRIVSSSVQSLSRGRIQGYDYEAPWLVIFDEAHHATADTWRMVAQWFGLHGPAQADRNPESRLLGVTATPKRADGEALGQIFAHVAAEYPIRWGVDQGWLVPIKTHTIMIQGLDFSKVNEDSKGDLSKQDLERILSEEGPLHGIAQKTIEHARGRPTLIFCATVPHSELLSQVINRYEPGSAAFLCGDSDKDLRRATIRAYKEGEYRYLCNCGLFLEGFDAPKTACVAMARPTKSISLYAQVLGRGTRPLSGLVDAIDYDHPDAAALRLQAIAGSEKPEMTMLDFVGQAGRHRLVGATDVLGGECNLEVLNLAQMLSQVRGEEGEDGIEALEAARAIREFEKLKRDDEEEKKRQAKIDHRAWLKANGVQAVEEEVDVFGRGSKPRKGGASPVEYKPVAKDPLTEKQWHYLRRLGVPAEDAIRFTKRQAGVVIDRLRQREEGA